MSRKALCIAFGLLAVFGCANTIDVMSNGDPDYDFKPHKTYRWAKTELSQTLPPQAANPAELDAQIRAAIDKTLKERGYIGSDAGDLTVAYEVHVSERVPADDTPPPAAWDPSMDITKYAQAALIVDFRDAATNNLVWRGGALTDVEKGEGRKHVDAVVDRLLRDFPPKQAK